jgi:N-acetylneuraminic acid mutarotase
MMRRSLERFRAWPAALLMALPGTLPAVNPWLDPVAANAAGRPTDAGHWTARPGLGTPRFAHEVVTVDGRILVIGGADANVEPLRSVEARRVNGNGRWSAVAPMPTARGNPAAAALDGMVYVAGGFTVDQTLDVVERYDPRADSWSTVAKLPAPRGAAGAAGLGGLLYVAGGFFSGSDEPTATVVAYDPSRRRWNSVASMHTARGELRLVAAGGRLYALGGISNDSVGPTLSTVERYNPSSDTWTVLAPMRQDRGVPGATAVQHGSSHLIVVVGGFTMTGGTLTRLRSTELYDLDTGRWQFLRAQLPQPTGSLGAAAEPDGTVLAIGGAVAVAGGTTRTATANVYALKLPDRDAALTL